MSYPDQTSQYPVDAPDSGPREAAIWRDYVALARPDHWIKHVFIIPGVVLAWILHAADGVVLVRPILLGFASAAAIASANYVLNEWLDAPKDAFHPSKSDRPAVRKQLSRTIVWVEYALLAVVGLALAQTVSKLFLITSLLFLASGWIYNIPPLRTKERAYADVLSESLNNPLRLTLGWAMVESGTLPPSSLLAAYWMGGAYLMALKRFAEYRSAVRSGVLENLTRYRGSFKIYTEDSLLLSAFLYALMSAFFLAVFLVKYRIEYLLSTPFLAALFTTYLQIALKEGSRAQTPERLLREKGLVVAAVLVVVSLVALTWIDLPILERLTSPHYIELPF